MSIDISPSILSANKEKIIDELSLAKHSGAKYIHLDVMDGKFVTNTTFSYDYVGYIASLNHGMINDVHLMIENPLDYIKAFSDAGSDIITFHYEATNEEGVYKAIDLIHSLGKKAGISIKPNTKPDVLDKFLDKLDLVLVMSVEPGKGGQAFMESALGKIEYLAKKKKENNYTYLIEVDGGINDVTGALCREKGVDILVAGSYLFGHEDFPIRAAKLLNLK